MVTNHGHAHLSEDDGEKLHNSVAVVGQLVVYVENIQCFGEYFHNQGREARETANKACGEGCTGGKIRPNARARQLVVRVDVGVRVEGKFSKPFPGHEAQNRPED
ncbi:hypothetical protein KL905_003484 [Ogataea polymorpha]|nr:hypothetical protein KL937_003534 [Ogataea polymorpha]KAG7899440.1 hypothetical protein KL935_003750 [Ogataea polymorpha]KAG7907568.1 hypothetical protein KL906_003649 [Ogataea polymorpha]KAG7919619.1 hypothetical protein KL905_003484 [Ogataea polymorpha]KAG7932933.1 hypothetical protein KL934_003588 [Ogataea polymorpha]